jgi:hypothetical protein
MYGKDCVCVCDVSAFVSERVRERERGIVCVSVFVLKAEL